MRLIAHVDSDGEIQGLIASTDGERAGALAAQPGIQVCEIEDAGLAQKELSLDALTRIFETYKVEVTPARGKLVRRRKSKA